LVLCDPSYEIKSDYAKVAAMMGDALKRFATGTYAMWYPIIAPAPKHTTCRDGSRPWPPSGQELAECHADRQIQQDHRMRPSALAACQRPVCDQPALHPEGSSWRWPCPRWWSCWAKTGMLRSGWTAEVEEKLAIN
jgi:hypothetical protein